MFNFPDRPALGGWKTPDVKESPGSSFHPLVKDQQLEREEKIEHEKFASNVKFSLIARPMQGNKES